MATSPTLSSTDNATNSTQGHLQAQHSTSPPSGPNHEPPSQVFITSKLEGGNQRSDFEDMSSRSTGRKTDLPPAYNPPRPYNQLPTPQSPSNFGHYVQSVPYTPRSPVPRGAQNSYTPLAPSTARQRSPPQRAADEGGNGGTTTQQIATPESSPFARTSARYANPVTPKHNRPLPRVQSWAPSDSVAATREPSASSSTLAQAHQISSPDSSFEPRSFQLSSPFMEKLSIAESTSKAEPAIRSRPQSCTPERHPMQVDDVFSSSTVSDSRHSAPSAVLPSSNSSPPPMSPPRPVAGGEMERIRQYMVQDRLAQFQEVESRRPEYLKRTKRTLSDADPIGIAGDDASREREREVAVGIMETPIKGRRLKLFQETSEESFEESLMAGGYGRYRTADWVRQPQPILLATPGSAGPSNIVSALEQADEPPPPTEKELKKRRRLAAFTERTHFDRPTTKLHPVELEGRGRVLLDIPAEGEDGLLVEGSPSKRKGAARRKKKSELTAREKKALALAAAAAGDFPEKPNWPDAEFPWRLRSEERAEELKSEQAEKMKWIARFLDRDTDDEDEDGNMAGGHQEPWGSLGDEVPVIPGRGKMVPLHEHPSARSLHLRKRSAWFPTDPADARAALMSKKSVRTLSYRQQKRKRQQVEDESDDEVLCICNGRDDGRELVQCDGCETWYHLQCIGIKDIAQLGKEEDPWFCRECEPRRSPSSEVDLPTEPTFVPTDDRPRASPSGDAPFFQPSSPQDSPMTWQPSRMPRTPTRNRGADYESAFSSASSWVESSRPRPSTPQHPAQGVRIYTDSTPGPFENYTQPYDESPFDPTSTPSRGIRFGAPFATPKNNVWSSRATGLFQTPSKRGWWRGTKGATYHGFTTGIAFNGPCFPSFARGISDHAIRRNRKAARFGPWLSAMMD
ncbi:putative PHD-finger [Lyophyllum shimeji]|uniref:PHD-finger n=1 Tax=Lyophyllum shimeji TaxID=47721 RepID=A0A9P3PJJ9_LYOSH|nr:putative PHD-finger [Lyophyllum shimeji]